MLTNATTDQVFECLEEYRLEANDQLSSKINEEKKHILIEDKARGLKIKLKLHKEEEVT